MISRKAGQMQRHFSICYLGMIVLALLCMGLSACSSTSSEVSDLEPAKAAELLYKQGQEAMQQGDLVTAIKAFKQIDSDYPYSAYSLKGLLDLALAYFQKPDYEKAIPILEKFLDRYPGSDKTDYALYLLGLCHYNQIADVRHDQDITLKAKYRLEQLVNRFPNSSYSTDAHMKLELVYDHMAGKEMEIGRYYLKRHEWIAAINRFRTVVKKYQQTTHIQEALHRLVEAYLSLGLKTEARKAALILGTNYPRSRWYHASYGLLEGNIETSGSGDTDNKTWLDSVWEGVS